MSKNILIGIILIFCVSCTVVYKFETDLKKNQDNISVYHKTYYDRSGMKFYGYSGHSSSMNSIDFPENDSDTWINIEHLVKLKAADIDIINDDELNNTNYLFSAVEIHENLDIVDIELNHYYKNRKLETKGLYIYYFNNSENAKTRYTVEKFNGSIPKCKHFIFVKIYKLPISAMRVRLLPKSLWFSDDIKQEAKLMYKSEDKIMEKNYNFNLTWTRREYWIT